MRMIQIMLLKYTIRKWHYQWIRVKKSKFLTYLRGSTTDDDKPSFFSRVFGCCDGRPDDEETDRGF